MHQARSIQGGKKSFAERYNHHFKVVHADTDELRDRVYKIRYQVYCVERPYEDPASNLNRREKDEFDAHSDHCLLLHRETGDVAGTVRLVLPLSGHDGPRFPILGACPQLSPWPERLLPAATTAEISRFTVSREFRRRLSDTLYADSRPSRRGSLAEARNRRSTPEVTIGLFRAIVEMSRANGITHWCAIMEPTLLRILARMGVYLHPFGPLVEYHGLRQPCYGKFLDIFDGLRKRRPDIWKAVAE
ncbi:MAG: PEP-CTERM/exosortase system-associated acyltransferase [Sphingomonadales bacterium]